MPGIAGRAPAGGACRAGEIPASGGENHRWGHALTRRAG